jgi:fermentation-respiration switch protein FrsA (DUF1100 family)
MADAGIDGGRAMCLKPIVAISAVFALAGCASLENRMVYHPRPFDEAGSPDAIQATDVELTTPAGKKVYARWYPQPGARGAVLYCPGNAGNLQTRAEAVRDLWAGLGESVLIFDYPGYGRSEGTPNEAACYEAADAAYDWLVREAKVPAERLLLYGESLGGGVAVNVASRRPHAALVLVRTFTSVPDVADYQMPLFPGYWLMNNRFDSISKIGQCKQPVFIAHGDQDQLIPVRQAEQLARACGSAAVELHVMRNIGHHDRLPTDFYPELRAFLAKQRLPPSP